MRTVLAGLNLIAGVVFLAVSGLAVSGISPANRRLAQEPEDFYGLIVATAICVLFAVAAFAAGFVLAKGKTVGIAFRRRTAIASAAAALLLGTAAATGLMGNRFRSLELAFLAPSLLAGFSWFVVR